MTAINLLASPAAELPKERPSGGFLQFVEAMFADYINELQQVQPTDPFSQAIVNAAANNRVLLLCAGITSALESHFNGFPHRAYEETKESQVQRITGATQRWVTGCGRLVRFVPGVGECGQVSSRGARRLR